MNEECLICKAPLEYLSADEAMECVLCHKKQYSKTRCVKGHFVCDGCHISGMDSIIAIIDYTIIKEDKGQRFKIKKLIVKVMLRIVLIS